MYRCFWLVTLLWLRLFGAIANVEVEVGETGETITTTDDTENSTTTKYSAEVIQLASTFPKEVLPDDLALKVAAKLDYIKRATFLLESFATEYGSQASVMLSELNDATPIELLETMGEVVQGIEDANTMFDGTTAEEVMKEMEEDGFFDDIDSGLMDEYRMNPRKIQDDTKEGLLYEFIAVAQAAGYVEIPTVSEHESVFEPLTDEEAAALAAKKQQQ